MKPNKYSKAKLPEPKVLIVPKGVNRKDRRKLLLGTCPCGSGKRYYKCHLPIEQERQESMVKQELAKLKEKNNGRRTSKSS